MLVVSILLWHLFMVFVEAGLSCCFDMTRTCNYTQVRLEAFTCNKTSKVVTYARTMQQAAPATVWSAPAAALICHGLIDLTVCEAGGP